MKKSFSIKEISDILIDLEKKYNLINWKVNNVHVWQSARVSIYTKILDQIIPNNSISNEQKTKHKYIFQRLIKNSFFHNPYFDTKKSNVLVFESGRKYLFGDKYIDIYTEYLCQNFHNEKISFRKYGTNYLADKLVSRRFTEKHMDFVLLFSKFISKFLRVSMPKSDSDKIQIIENEINSSFGTSLNLESIFLNEIKRFKSQYPFYLILFLIKKPEIIYLTNSSDKSALIKAAKDCNITTIELQHGLIVKEELIGHFPHIKEDSLEYFPNKFAIWENLDMCTCKLPLSENNILKIPNYHLIQMLQNNSNIIRDKRQILIVSQPYYSDDIFNFIRKNAATLCNWKLIYKIHPSEDTDFFLRYIKNQPSDESNIIFVTNDVSIYQLFSESEYVLGVFSTAVFEAPFFGCKTILLNVPGVELAEILIQNKKARLINIDERLLDFLS